MRDIVSEIGSFYTGLAALPVIKTNQVATGVDLANYDGCLFYILAGNWTDGTLTPVLEESDDNSTWNTIADADLVNWSATSSTSSTAKKVGGAQPTAISSAATAINQRVGYIGGKRYVRCNMTVTGSPATGAGYDVVIVAGRPRFMPSDV